MAAQILKVTFEVTSQAGRSGAFTIPEAVLDALGIDQDSRIALDIWSPKGALTGTFKMSSKNEVDETRANLGLGAVIDPGTKLLVVASRPQP